LQAKHWNSEIEWWCKKLGAVFVKRKRFRNPLNFISELCFLWRIKNKGFDIIWFNTTTFYQSFWAKICLKNFLVMVHDVEFHPKSKNYFGLFSQKITLWLIRQHICVASKTQSAIFKNLYGKEPVIMQLPIIDYYSATPQKNLSVQKNNNRTLKFFYFGTIEPYKGIETLIEAAGNLENKNVTFKLNIYGKLKYNQEVLFNRISHLKSITLINKFIDYQDVYSVYTENDVLVLPYRQVTQCGPLLIAYNENMPVICSDLPGFREYVDDNRSGLIYNNSPEDLANKILFFINNPQFVQYMHDYIRIQIHNRYSMNKLADVYITNLEKCTIKK
jgi:glycosyltransferase involved in cell wall biosynthesis